MLVALLTLFLGLATAPLADASAHKASEIHPSDGPDVDLRISLREGGVKASVTLNLAFVDEIIEVARESESAIHPAEVDGLHQQLFEHLREGLRIEIDELAIVPIDKGFSWEPADETLLPLFPNAGARALIRVRLMLEFPAKSNPESVRISWSDYPPDTAIADRDEADPLEVQMQLSVNGADQVVRLAVDQPSFLWRGSLLSPIDRFKLVPEVVLERGPPVPFASFCLLVFAIASAMVLYNKVLRIILVTAFCIGAFAVRGQIRFYLPTIHPPKSLLPTEEQALAIFKPLHANIYRAFDYESESDVYDALARSASGEMLDELYDEIFKSLVLADEGGAVCKVQRVNLLETEIEEISRAEDEGAASFDLSARWQVEGAVYHWGHSHWRTNEYQARYQVRADERGWRITQSQILEQFRVSSSPTAPEPELDLSEIGEL